jgi:hypothetical protein
MKSFVINEIHSHPSSVIVAASPSQTQTLRILNDFTKIIYQSNVKLLCRNRTNHKDKGSCHFAHNFYTIGDI